MNRHRPHGGRRPANRPCDTCGHATTGPDHGFGFTMLGVCARCPECTTEAPPPVAPDNNTAEDVTDYAAFQVEPRSSAAVRR